MATTSVLVLLFSVLAATTQPLAVGATPAGFETTNVITGLNRPTNMEFASDGRIFVAEQGGLLKVFDGIDDTTATIVADLRDATHAVDGRGLLGLALDPDFPNTPDIYVMYAHDAPIGGTAPTYGVPGATNDECPNPPGPGECVVSGRISRLVLNGDVAVSETVILEDWCQEWTSHSVGDLRFGADGSLFATSGEGAFAGQPDWGQRGQNGCVDPPTPHGGSNQSAATGEGGAFRSQDMRTTGDPTGLSGTVIRIDKNTGLAHPGNVNFGNADDNVARIIAYGLRNPYRTAFRPGTDELWIADVGWNTWEEINLLENPDTEVLNYGWPCYEGSDLGYDIGSNLCNALVAEGPSAVEAPYYQYEQTVAIVDGGDPCLNNNGSPSALTFYDFGAYPSEYDGAFFFGDYSRRCVWSMFAGPDGRPDPSTAHVMMEDIAVTDLTRGPNGDIYALNIFGGGGLGGTIVRLSYPAGGTSPLARLTVTPDSGPVPLMVTLDASTTTPGAPGDVLSFDWDLDGDGNFGDATGAIVNHTYNTEAQITAQVKVSDQNGEQATASHVIFAGTPPTVAITSPSGGTSWAVDDILPFAGSAVDGLGNPIPASGLSWDLILHHCETLDDCHTHNIGTIEGVASGDFFAPEHEYPSFIEVNLTATSASGLSATQSLELFPDTALLTLEGTPSGIEAGFNGKSVPTPSDHEVIVGSINTLSAPSTQTVGGFGYNFVSWSDGGAQTHDLTVLEDQSVTLEYIESPDPVLYLSSTSGGNVDGISFADEDVLSFNTGTETWEMMFDGSDVGVGTSDLDGFAIVSLDPFVADMSFDQPRIIPGIGSIDDSDVVRFSGTPGPDTAGSFELRIDGSDVSFRSSSEDIDAISLLGTDYAFSTSGGYNLGSGVAGLDEDLVLFSPSSTGPVTSGSSSVLFDGSDVGLMPRDLFGASFDQASGDLYGAGFKTYTVGGFSGDPDDVFLFSGTTGPNTAGTAVGVFDGDDHGYGREQIDALHVSIGSGSAVAGAADLAITIDDDITGSAVVGDTVTFTIDVTNNGPDTALGTTASIALPAGLTATATSGCAGDPLGLPCNLGTIASGQSVQVSVTASVAAGGNAGSVTTTASVASSIADPVSGNNSDSVDSDVVQPPAAEDDGPVAGSAPGDPFHTDSDTTLEAQDGSVEDLLANDSAGDPAGTITSFGGGDLGGAVTDNAAGATVNVGSGELTVSANGAFSFTPDTGFSGEFSFDYQVTNLGGTDDATATIFVGPRMVVGDAVIYLSSTSGGNAGGVVFADEDVVAFDTATGTWSMMFDGSDVGIGASDVDGLDIISLSPFIVDMSFDKPRTIPGVGSIDDSDVVRFTGTSGANTSGSFEVLIDGSDVSLTTYGEDIDAISTSGNDRILSTIGAFNLGGGVTGADEDLFLFTPTLTGTTTTGSSAFLFDGSDVGIGARDITGIWSDPVTGDLYGSALNTYTIAGLVSDSDDIFMFSGTTGATTSGVATRFFDGDSNGFANEQIDALHIIPKG